MSKIILGTEILSNENVGGNFTITAGDRRAYVNDINTILVSEGKEITTVDAISVCLEVMRGEESVFTLNIPHAAYTYNELLQAWKAEYFKDSQNAKFEINVDEIRAKVVLNDSVSEDIKLLFPNSETVTIELTANQKNITLYKHHVLSTNGMDAGIWPDTYNFSLIGNDFTELYNEINGYLAENSVNTTIGADNFSDNFEILFEAYGKVSGGERQLL